MREERSPHASRITYHASPSRHHGMAPASLCQREKAGGSVRKALAFGEVAGVEDLVDRVVDGDRPLELSLPGEWQHEGGAQLAVFARAEAAGQVERGGGIEHRLGSRHRVAG